MFLPRFIFASLLAGVWVHAEPDGGELLEIFCFDCHGDGFDKGGISLEEWLEKDPGEGHHDWERAWKIARHELMPPADEMQPTFEERRKIVDWVARTRLGVDPAAPDPGRVTIRRLNRMEYEHTVTDLFGVELRSEGVYSSDSSVATKRLRDMLPPDDKAFGFDNIGDFQSLSPALLEQYFEIAGFIVGEVVSTDGPSFPERELDGLQVDESAADGPRVDHVQVFRVDEPGEYTLGIRFSLGGWADYGGGYDFGIELDGAQLVRERIDVGGQKTHLWEPTLRLEPGEHRLSFHTVARDPDSDGRLRHLRLRPKLWLTGPLDPERASYSESHQRVFFDGEAPADEEARDAYAREILRRVADRAFRRPVEEDTLDRLVAIARRIPHFERGVADALTAILTSPKFLYRAEAQPQPNDPESVHPIDEYALASRLSYLLWLSLPDERLRELAAAGELRDKVDGEIERMLGDPKAERFFEDFPGQWLRTRNVLMTPVSRRDEEINSVRASMKRETEKLFEHLVREDLDLLELVTADYTFVDRRLAEFYGLEGFEGGGFRKVDLPPESNRGGILTQGSFLVATSNPNRTSPVKRGLYVLETLMAVEPPPPPPDIPALDDVRVDGQRPTTTREQLELHRQEKSCASCHAHFDPLGLVLENFDSIGRWRDDEGGEPIVPNETTVTGETLTGVGDIRDYFERRRDKFYRCVTEKLMTYALGRGLGPADAITVDHITGRLMDEGGRFSVLLSELVESRPFQMRRGDDGRVIEPPRADLPEPPPPEMRKGRRFRPDAFRRAQKAAAERAETTPEESGTE